MAAPRDWHADIRAFHEACDICRADRPTAPGDAERELRKRLIEEERAELFEALDAGDLAQIAKESIDLVYVVIGTLVSYGIDPHPVWEAVHASNMVKARGPRRPDGKVLKPEGWRAPDIASLIEAQRRTGA